MSTALRRYFRGYSLVAMQDGPAGQTRTFHFDHQGTTQCLTNQAGVVTDRFASDAWGAQVKRTGTSINRHWYIGQWGYIRSVDRALEYVRARNLNLVTASWLAIDCFRIASVSPYSYASNQPTATIDPSGLWTVEDQICAANGNSREGFLACPSPTDVIRVVGGEHTLDPQRRPGQPDRYPPGPVKRLAPDDAARQACPVNPIPSRADCILVNASFFSMGGNAGDVQGQVRTSCSKTPGIWEYRAGGFRARVGAGPDFVHGRRRIPEPQQECTQFSGLDGQGRNVALKLAGQRCFLVVEDGKLTNDQVCNCLRALRQRYNTTHQAMDPVELDGGSSAALYRYQNGQRVTTFVPLGKERVPVWILICGSGQIVQTPAPCIPPRS